MNNGSLIEEQSLPAVDQYVGCFRRFEVPLKGFVGIGQLKLVHLFVIESIPGLQIVLPAAVKHVMAAYGIGPNVQDEAHQRVVVELSWKFSLVQLF